MSTLLVLVIAGLLGPLLAAPKWRMPVVVGEILGGMIVGPQLLGWLSVTDPISVVLHDAGFALLMFGIGIRLPLRDSTLRRRFPVAAAAVVLAAVLAAAVAIGISKLTGINQPWVIAVLLATSSASIAMPIIRESDPDLQDRTTAGAAAWILLADILTILFLPLLGGTEASFPGLLLSSVALTVVAAVLIFILTRVSSMTWWQHTRKESKANHWGWDLRIAMLLLFSFIALASMWGTSPLIAGFTAGIVMNLTGPDSYRLGQQLVGIGEGFLIPVFFVVLGARLDISAFFTASLWYLVGLMLLGTILVHIVAAKLTRQHISVGLVASAQMGVPAAIATLGVTNGWLSPAYGTAFMATALLSVAVSSYGAALMERYRASF